MEPVDGRTRTALKNGARILPPEVRDLYRRLCIQLVALSRSIKVEAAPFETRFQGPGNMYVSISPYREKFLVSVGRETPCQIRVSSREGFFRALDMSLEHYLSARSKYLHPPDRGIKF
ncbi:MAG: hypothetical protein JXB45_05680 [Candidatus Krumholzibacteriota bacterium]|nr:hypothetical protein [Candidatus Krumholzibacteriota bacterium]